jgi:hypothetical protein
LGIGALSYLTASYFCLIFPVVTIILGYLTRHGDKMTTQQSLSAQAVLNASKES